MGDFYYDGLSVKNHRAENMDGLFLGSRTVSGHKLLLAVICDGVGSTRDGAFAARTAIRLLNDWLDAVEYSAQLGLKLRDKVLEINQFIVREAETQKLNTASTISSLLIDDDKYYIIHLGDSRIYSYKDGILRQLTHDDISGSGKLTAYLGRRDQAVPFFDEGNARGTRFLLCSDGLYKTLDPTVLKAALERITYKKIRKNAEELIGLAMDRGERDNISVALIIQER